MRVAVEALALVAVVNAVSVYAQGNPQGTIQHVIVIIQENRTPDFLFAGDTALPVGANIATSGKCKDSNGISTVALQPQLLYGGSDIGHSYSDFVAMYDSGNMDGANSEFYLGGSHVCSSNPLPFGYARNDSGTIPANEAQPYFDIASHYGFANYMFQTNQGPSFPAHQFLFAGTSAPTAYPNLYYDYFASENPMYGTGEKGSPAGCLSIANEFVLDISTSKQESQAYTPPVPSWATPGYPCYGHNSIKDVLDPHNISWKYYAYDPTSLWAAPNAIESICVPTGNSGSVSCTGADWPNVIRESPSHVPPNAGQILNDIFDCQLAQVSYVTPDGVWSDHAGGNTNALGPSWVAAIVDAIGNGMTNSRCNPPGQSVYWGNTVILITWDDWGGWYDHVAPPSIGYEGSIPPSGGQYVYGFRVPLLVVSAYAKPGYVSGPNGYNTCPSNQYCHDFGSILNFIEYVFGTSNQSLGEINPSYHYADYYALDASPNCPITTCPYALSDFFDFTTFHNFVSISAPEPALYFMTYNGVSQPPDLD
jgi:phospholipase C